MSLIKEYSANLCENKLYFISIVNVLDIIQEVTATVFYVST